MLVYSVISNDLAQIFNFTIWIIECVSLRLFWIYFYPLTLIFVLKELSCHWANSKEEGSFSLSQDYSRTDWDGLCNHWIDVSWDAIFNFNISAALYELNGLIQVGIDVSILNHEHWIKLHSFPCLFMSCLYWYFIFWKSLLQC